MGGDRFRISAKVKIIKAEMVNMNSWVERREGNFKYVGHLKKVTSDSSMARNLVFRVDERE